MTSKLIRVFLSFSGILLILTAVAKFISGFGTAGILEIHDPILKIKFRFLFYFLGGLELAVGLFCLLGSKSRLQAGLVAWLATVFFIYHLGLTWIGYQKTCPCLGNLTDALDISPHVADFIMKVILMYLLLGSYGTLFWLWRKPLEFKLSFEQIN